MRVEANLSRKKYVIGFFLALICLVSLSGMGIRCAGGGLPDANADSTRDSLDQGRIDSLSKTLYNYYDSEYACSQAQEQLASLLSQMNASESKMGSDSMAAVQLLRKICADTSLGILDTILFQQVAGQWAKVPGKNDRPSALSADSLYRRCFKFSRKGSLGRKDSVLLSAQLESYRSVVQKQALDRVDWEVNKNSYSSTQHSYARNKRLSDSLSVVVDKTVAPEFTRLLDQQTDIISEKSYRKKKYLVFRYPVGQDSLELGISGNATGNPRTVKTYWNQLLAQKRTPVMVMNAGMYQPDYSAQGLLIEDMKSVNKIDSDSSKGRDGNFYLHPNGVFFIMADGRCSLKTTPAFIRDHMMPGSLVAVKGPKIRFATQSGPMLVVNGKIHRGFNPGSSNLNIRNGIGIRNKGKDGQEIFMVISENMVSFHEMASFYKDVLKCSDALYLDGVVSRANMQLGKVQRGELDNRQGLGPLLVVTKKKK
jgi:uncharacterized protein YigE (DUF2233 family)